MELGRVAPIRVAIGICCSVLGVAAFLIAMWMLIDQAPGSTTPIAVGLSGLASLGAWIIGMGIYLAGMAIVVGRRDYMSDNGAARRIDLSLLLPPIVHRAATNLKRYGSIRATPEYGSIVTNRNDLAAVSGSPWEHQNWLSHIAGVERDPPTTPFSHATTLMLLCAELGDVGVFDFGGGPAVLYPSAKHSADELNYVVLENPLVAEIGKGRFSEVKFIQDAAEAPALVSPGGITLCVGTLHYILDWRDLLSALVATAPKYLMIGRHPSPETAEELWGVQTIYTPHGYCGQAQMAFIPVHMLAAEMEKLGYRLYADLPLSDQQSHVVSEYRNLVGALSSRTIVFKQR